MKFYTGMNTIVLFDKIFKQPCLYDIIYWKAPKHTKTLSNVSHWRCNTPKNLSQRLRLGLLNEDLAERFGVSSILASYIFITWIKLLSKAFSKALIVQPPKKFIREYLAEIFIRSGYGKCLVMIDSAEVFIEKPKPLSAQDATWSDHKHHNTFKFLIEITPTGFISFVSSCYGGRESHKFISRNNELYDLSESDDEVMADRGLQTQED